MVETRKTSLRGDRKLKKSKTTYIGSILIVVSALLPCLDVVLKWIFPSLWTLRDSTDTLISTNIWLGTLYVAPTIILIAVNFKPNPKLYVLPITMYFYTGMVYYAPILGFKINFLRINSFIAGIYSVLAAMAVMFIIRYIKRLVLDEETNEEFYNDTREEFKILQDEIDELKLKLKTQEKKNYE